MSSASCRARIGEDLSDQDLNYAPRRSAGQGAVVRFIRSAVVRASAHFQSIRICRQQLGRRDVRPREQGFDALRMNVRWAAGLSRPLLDPAGRLLIRFFFADFPFG